MDIFQTLLIWIALVFTKITKAEEENHPHEQVHHHHHGWGGHPISHYYGHHSSHLTSGHHSHEQLQHLLDGVDGRLSSLLQQGRLQGGISQLLGGRGQGRISQLLSGGGQGGGNRDLQSLLQNLRGSSGGSSGDLRNLLQSGGRGSGGSSDFDSIRGNRGSLTELIKDKARFAGLGTRILFHQWRIAGDLFGHVARGVGRFTEGVMGDSNSNSGLSSLYQQLRNRRPGGGSGIGGGQLNLGHLGLGGHNPNGHQGLVNVFNVGQHHHHHGSSGWNSGHHSSHSGHHSGHGLNHGHLLREHEHGPQEEEGEGERSPEREPDQDDQTHSQYNKHSPEHESSKTLPEIPEFKRMPEEEEEELPNTTDKPKKVTYEHNYYENEIESAK